MNENFKKCVSSAILAFCVASLPFSAFGAGGSEKITEEKKPFKNSYSEVKLGAGKMTMFEQSFEESSKNIEKLQDQYHGEGFNAIEGDREKLPSIYHFYSDAQSYRKGCVNSILNKYDIVIIDSGSFGAYWLSSVLKNIGVYEEKMVWKKELMPLNDFCANLPKNNVFDVGYKLVLTNTRNGKKIIFYVEFGNVFSRKMASSFDVRAECCAYNSILSVIMDLNPVTFNGTFPKKIKKQMIGTFYVGDRVQGVKVRGFSCCFNLGKVCFYGNLDNLGDLAFQECINLESVVFEKNVNTVGDEAFRECYFLKEVVFEGKLRRLGQCVFRNCRNLKNIFIPNSLEEICSNTFDFAPDDLQINYKNKTFSKQDFLDFFAISGGKICKMGFKS